MAVPLAAMIPNARIEATIAFMTCSSDRLNIIQALVPSCDSSHKKALCAAGKTVASRYRPNLKHWRGRMLLGSPRFGRDLGETRFLFHDTSSLSSPAQRGAFCLW